MNGLLVETEIFDSKLKLFYHFTIIKTDDTSQHGQEASDNMHWFQYEPL